MMLRIPLYQDMFEYQERDLFHLGEFSAVTFRYSTGVAGLQIKNSVGHMTILPYQGQQIWDLQLFNRRQTMRSLFEEPIPNVSYLETYGAFLLHCGFTAFGSPGEQDTHELHGELPNAAYTQAAILGGEDEYGKYVSVTGMFEYAKAFAYRYQARPEVRMYEQSGVLQILFTAKNLSKVPMEYMYLAHVNFLPVDRSNILYTAVCNTNTVRIRDTVPSHLAASEKYKAFLASLRKNPEHHHVLRENEPYNPEAVFFIDMHADTDGYAHNMQMLPTKEADIISYQPAQLDHAIRWISRTPDQDALGLLLPATAEPDGYTMEKKKGNIKELSPGAAFTCNYFTGSLTAPAAQRYAEHIKKTMEGKSKPLDLIALDGSSR